VKWLVVKDKLEGKLTTREIIGKYDFKNKSQVEKTWIRWSKKGETYRFDQPIGKQNSFRHGLEFAGEDECTSNQVTI
jgi:transposase